MAIVTLSAFVSGFAAGWVARGFSGAPRSEAVRSVAKGLGVSDAIRRWVSERAEWVEDLVAEGQAYHEAMRRGAPVGEREAEATSFAEEGPAS